MYPWSHWRTLAPLYAGAVGLGCFMFWSKLREQPILPASMFRDRTALTTYFGTTIHGIFLGSMIYYMVRHLSVLFRVLTVS